MPYGGKKLHIVILGILNGFLLISLIFSCILHFLSKEEMGSACFSWCKSKISWCSKHSGEKTSLNQPSEQNTYDLIASPAKESRCKCKNRCKAENSGDDGIENNSIGINGKAIEILEEVNSLFNRNRKSFSLLSRKLV